MLPPYELRNKEFTKVMRGYNPSEVDEHVNFIIEKYTELYRENDELERKLKAAYTKLDEIKTDEETIRNAMVNAQRASSKIMTEANDRADIILSTARKTCDRILADFNKKIQAERAILIALNSSISEFKENLFKSYNSHIAFIEDIKLLNEDEIVEYALSDEGFNEKVIQSIKSDIIKNSEDKVCTECENSDNFVEADIVSGQALTRENSVKDTIKKINKRITGDEDAITILRKAGIKVTDDINSENIKSEGNESDDFADSLGVTGQVDIPEKN